MKHWHYKSPKHAYRAGRRHAKQGKPHIVGVVAWPGHYMEGYRSVKK